MKSVSRILQYISDVHVDEKHIIPVIKPILGSKIIAILGDVGIHTHKNVDLFFRQVSDNFKTVLFVPGNNDYGSSPFNLKLYEENKPIIKEICKKYSNVIVLDNEIYKDEDTTFIGTTLWSDCKISLADDIFKFPHYYKNCLDHNLKHKQDLNWLIETIEKHKDNKAVIDA